MNKLRIRAIALGLLTGKLAESGLGYHQRSYIARRNIDSGGRDCQTTACIGGTAVALYDPEAWEAYQTTGCGDMFNKGRLILGLDSCTATDLFDAMPDISGHFRYPDPRHTAAVLFKLAETGQVDWDVSPADWLPSPAKLAALS